MRSDRRVFLAGWLAVAGTPLWLRAQRQSQNSLMPSGQQQPPPSTSRPDPTPTFPRGAPAAADSDSDSIPISSASGDPNPRLVLQQDRKELQHDADVLLEMAQDLKKQVDSLDTTEVLSLDLVHKAEGIEKLARQMKSLMQAS
jgi:hypothetical protein